MESVVKAVKKEPEIEETPEEGELKENLDKQPNILDKRSDEKSRKRHRDSDDEKSDRRRRDDYHRVGRRYWDDEEEDSRRRSARDRRDDRRNEDKVEDSKNKDQDVAEPMVKRKPKEDELLTTRTGGAYIPPARLRMMQAEVTDKSSIAFQRLAWEALKKSIHGLINKVNVSNIKIIIPCLLRENLVRGRGLLCRSITQAQAASPTFTNVYAAVVAVINSKFPNIGELLLSRLILQFRRGFRRNDKIACTSSTTFIAHLVNQQVVHELLALEILTLLLENATDDSVEVAINFLKQCGQKLGEVSPRGLTAIFDRLRHVLHEADLDKRVKYAIEVLFQVRKDGFKDNPAIAEHLDLVEEDDQFTHMLSIQETDLNPDDILNVFQHDPNYVENEQKYQAVKNEILGSDADENGDSSDGDDEDDGSEEDEEESEEKKNAIVDETETNLIALRRTIYLTIQSSLDHNECAHKMMKMQLKPGQEIELCHMILDCCAQQRTYEKFFGLLAQRFCQINKIYIGPFEQIFKDTYDTIHRLDTNKMRNVGKMFAHLLFTDAISWDVFSHIRLTETDTTSSSRIFLKILFQELAEYMGLPKLNGRLSDPTLQTSFEGIFPRDDPRNTRFAINYFTSIGLGGLTDDLREYLRTHPKPPPVSTAAAQSSELSAAAAKLLLEDSSSDSDSSSSSSSSSDSSDSSSSDDSSSSSASSGSSKKKSRKDGKESKLPNERTESKDRNRYDDSRRRVQDLKRTEDDKESSKRHEHRDVKRRSDEESKRKEYGESRRKDEEDSRRKDEEGSKRKDEEVSKRRVDEGSGKQRSDDSRRPDDESRRRRYDDDRSRRQDRDGRDRRSRRDSRERDRDRRRSGDREKYDRRDRK